LRIKIDTHESEDLESRVCNHENLASIAFAGSEAAKVFGSDQLRFDLPITEGGQAIVAFQPQAASFREFKNACDREPPPSKLVTATSPHPVIGQFICPGAVIVNAEWMMRGFGSGETTVTQPTKVVAKPPDTYGGFLFTIDDSHTLYLIKSYKTEQPTVPSCPRGE
jgi:hypothetical protein